MSKQCDWKPHRYNDSDTEGILSFMGSYDGRADVVQADYFAWQNINNPAGKAEIYLAQAGDKVVGQYLVIPINIQLGGNIIPSALSLNTLTRPDFQRKGIFTGLANLTYQACAERGIKLVYGFPNKNSYPGFVKKLGFIDIGNIPLLIKPLNPRKIIKRHVRNKIGSCFLGIIGQIISPLYFNSLSFSKGNKFSAERIIRFDESFNEFWKEIRTGYTNIVIRNELYLNWRYCANRQRKYVIFTVKEHNKVKGFILLRCTELNNVNAGLIVDILVESSQEGLAVAKCLIAKALQYFREHKMDLAGCLMLPQTIAFQALKNRGFRVCPAKFKPRSFCVIIKSLSDQIPQAKANDMKNWYFTMGDYDAV